MKIVTWNCNGAFRKKFENISDLNADLYIIQECENPSESKDVKYQKWAENYIWIGENKNKGLAVFAKPEIKLEKLDWTNQFNDHSVKHFLPCKINGDFNLLAVWTHKNNSPNFGYIGQLWKYLQINKNKLKESLIIGDFNSNTIWDEWDRWWNHSDVVNELKELGIDSFYHRFKKEIQGKEKKPTLYFQRNITKPYHIDYIFGAQKFCDRLKSIEIGQYDQWIKLSDHMPMVCEIEY
ncbi:endonuclease/exonuclease/phosphatase family protein [Kaistella jeonii]|uniref:Endonuclease n=1 Tax=Kaistella jeonii TaxID=266749 RepID=A0A0C1FEW6_9FLAO|nr:endonuclease/exonuclease/phosphatase family protein [Kaistella jeonii]KIA90358.1 endonuclease [Kaistella jeonii]SFB74011.1 Exonuclease III [Kaistella jeonii]VEI95093.1 exodeoxyribonuclease III [Kaistella jeonii]